MNQNSHSPIVFTNPFIPAYETKISDKIITRPEFQICGLALAVFGFIGSISSATWHTLTISFKLCIESITVILLITTTLPLVYFYTQVLLDEKYLAGSPSVWKFWPLWLYFCMGVPLASLNFCLKRSLQPFPASEFFFEILVLHLFGPLLTYVAFNQSDSDTSKITLRFKPFVIKTVPDVLNP